MRSLLLLLSLCFSLPAFGGTWIVDDDGGPGVDFTDIQPAIDAAAPGDLVLVRAGQYEAFLLDKALVVMGVEGESVEVHAGALAVVQVRDVTSGKAAALVNLGLNCSVDVDACTVPVLVDHCPGPDLESAQVLSVSNCSDVRVRASDHLRVFAGDPFSGLSEPARVEYADGTVKGFDGFDGCPGGDGFPAFFAGPDSALHVYRSRILGGDPGTTTDPYNCGFGLSLQGIRVKPQGFALVTGDDPSLSSGVTVEAGGVARVSDIVASASGFPGATIEQAVPADPTLEILTPVAPGQVLTFRAHATPGAVVDLNLGRFGVVQETPGTTEDVLISTLRTFPLGVVGASGVAGLNFTVPSSLPQGFVFFAQARVSLPGGETRYTNSVPVVLR